LEAADDVREAIEFWPSLMPTAVGWDWIDFSVADSTHTFAARPNDAAAAEPGFGRQQT
jgi:hypothetical protein